MRNLITDVPGVLVGNADDAKLASGVTAIVFEEPAVAGVDVRGGAPGTRDTDLLRPDETIERVDAIVLSGGSGFGLDSPAACRRGCASTDADLCSGRWSCRSCRARSCSTSPTAATRTGAAFRPIAISATRRPPVPALPSPLGTAGAGYGAKTVNLKGGLGSASATTRDGATVGAIVAVNALGSVTVGDGPHFWAAPFEQRSEFGGRGLPTPFPAMP